MFVQISLNSHFPVNEGGGGVVAVAVITLQEREEVDIIVADVTEGGVDGGELEGATVLREVTICLVGGGDLADRDTVVRQHLGENKEAGLVAR